MLYDGRGGREIVAKLAKKARPPRAYCVKRDCPTFYIIPTLCASKRRSDKSDYENLLRYDEMYLDEKGETDFKRVVKLLAFVDEGDSESEAIVDGAAAAIGLKALRTAPHSYEIVPPLADKGRALKITAKRLGVHFRMTAAVGDSMNDLPMLAPCAACLTPCPTRLASLRVSALPSRGATETPTRLSCLTRFRAGFYKQRRVI